MSNKVVNAIEQMCRDHFNEPVLMTDVVGRLVGYAEDDMDCYLVVDYPCSRFRRARYHTAVGGYMFLDLLKNQGCVTSRTGEKWNDYTRIESHLSLNGAPPVSDFICERLPDYRSEALVDSEDKG